jgi:hypothetical protein
MGPPFERRSRRCDGWAPRKRSAAQLKLDRAAACRGCDWRDRACRAWTRVSSSELSAKESRVTGSRVRGSSVTVGEVMAISSRSLRQAEVLTRGVVLVSDGRRRTLTKLGGAVIWVSGGCIGTAKLGLGDPVDIDEIPSLALGRLQDWGFPVGAAVGIVGASSRGRDCAHRR